MSDETSPYLLDEVIDFGQQLIGRTRQLVLSLWNRSRIYSELKDDDTPVSEVDLRCEELVRHTVRQKFPSHGILGEEFGWENEGADFTWTIDPIDGTQNLINRIPTFGTILGLLHKGEPIMGWIDHPVLGDSLYGGPSQGTFYNDVRVYLGDLPESGLSSHDIIGTNCPATFSRGGHLGAFDAILKFHPHSRIYYDVYAHSLAIRGCLAVAVEFNLKLWDLVATKALIQGAGGVYRELGRQESASGSTVYHAAFGKPRAVASLAKAIEPYILPP
jgi:inositol-phosphate phosphatase/L-galactose 1-phosphate phosphatase/histidinol-phosphatase